MLQNLSCPPYLPGKLTTTCFRLCDLSLRAGYCCGLQGGHAKPQQCLMRPQQMLWIWFCEPHDMCSACMQEVEEDLEEVYAIDEQLRRLDAREEGAMDVLKGIQVRSIPPIPALACIHEMCASYAPASQSC